MATKYSKASGPIQASVYDDGVFNPLVTGAAHLQRLVEEVLSRYPEDSTRLPEFYDGTYRYLKSLGLEEL